jgi:hypothetical protein
MDINVLMMDVGKDLLTRNSLKQHERIDLIERKLKCEIDGCNSDKNNI